MAGGIDWFRWHHGSVTDPKFQLVAKKAGARFGDVVAVWAFALEAASASDERGHIGATDCESIDCMLGADDGTAARIIEAMTARGLIADGRIASWEKRQPKRERDDDKSTERVRAFREKQRQETPGNATERQETPRGEESREDLKPSSLAAACPRPSSDDPAAPQLSLVEQPAEPGRKGLPSCPHLEVLALWAEVLPSMPQHDASQWRGSRSDHLRARWRETAEAKKWVSQEQGLTYLRRFFTHVGKSQFLTGREHDPKRRPFFAELAWLVEPLNWAKTHEGKFHQEAA